MEGKKLVELAYDIQSGLGNVDVPDFDRMRTMGMAAIGAGSNLDYCL